MRWTLDKLSSLLGTILAAVMGASASQMVAYVNAYLQRLGGHIDEARQSLQSLRAGEMSAMVADAATRDQLVAGFQRRLAELESARGAIEAAGPFARPLALMSHLDRAIAGATFEKFTPAVPLDAPSLVYAVAGMVLGWLVWELVKLPVAAVFRA